MGNKPTHRVATPIGRDGKKTYWQDIGSGWENEKGNIMLDLNAFPAKGCKLIVCPVGTDEADLVDIDVELAED